MTTTAERTRPRLSVEIFRGFTAGRPEEERWELIDGVAVMMTPPTIPHQRMAMNLLGLLNTALAAHSPQWMAYQRVGLNLGSSVQHYDPEPDVVVIDSELSHNPDERYADRFYLAAEVVSSSDRDYCDNKREIYKLHDACACVLTIQQDRVEVRVDNRLDAGWTHEVLTALDDTLALPAFGLHCRVADLYRGTALQPR